MQFLLLNSVGNLRFLVGWREETRSRVSTLLAVIPGITVAPSPHDMTANTPQIHPKRRRKQASDLSKVPQFSEARVRLAS